MIQKDCLSPLSAVFIQKTYDMICQCDPNIATWNDCGDVFIVKDPVRLASMYIPRYFDHRNFSSFSRQLNFYGFRKIHTLHEASAIGSVHYIRFYHEFFRKGRPDLLCKIKRSTLSNSSSKASNKEIEVLKKTVANLEDKIAKMSREFELKLKEMYEVVKDSKRQCDCSANREENSSAKRIKIDPNFNNKVESRVKENESKGNQADFKLTCGTSKGNEFNHCGFLGSLTEAIVYDGNTQDLEPLDTIETASGALSVVPIPQQHSKSTKHIPEGEVVRFLSDIFTSKEKLVENTTYEENLRPRSL